MGLVAWMAAAGSVVADDDLVREELQRRSLWEQFLAARDGVGRRPRAWAVITDTDVFVGFEGFRAPGDNGLVWVHGLSPETKASVLEAFVLHTDVGK
jgi:hypothetical protein